MTTGKIITGILIAGGVGAAIYYGFIKKFDDGLTGIQKLTGKKEKKETAPVQPKAIVKPEIKTKPLGSTVMDALYNPNADLGLITSQVGSVKNILTKI